MNCRDCDYCYTIPSGKANRYVCNCPNSEHKGTEVNEDTGCDDVLGKSD